MASILNELLDLARIEARGALDFNIKDVDLADVVLTVVNDFSTPDGRTPPEIDIFHVNCFIDFAKSIQALSNIVSNAYKYSLHGPVRVSMRTSDEMKEFILIDVIDNGIGIGEEDKQRLFERFFRADTSCSIPGTGLGLSIVREIMSNMGGGIYFDSVVNQGSTFTLSYPLSRVSYQETQNSVGSNTHHVIQIG
jgi:signal transduction histidine kinase